MTKSTELKCCVCGKRMIDGHTMYRLNKTGEPGVWGCEAHRGFNMPQDVLDICHAIESERDDEKGPYDGSDS